ncbi:MAG: DUF3781 domain-containing protein [Rickettsiales bacterium]|nr:DUF3781 domain-containing protein [Rickettsiales bacterium]
MMNIPIESLHTTMLGEKRIKRNLGLETNDVVSWCKSAVSCADKGAFVRKGKNWYVYGDNYVLTINAYSNTIITAHKLA